MEQATNTVKSIINQEAVNAFIAEKFNADNAGQTFRGDVVRDVAIKFNTVYANVYMKVRTAEEKLNIKFGDRKGRRPGVKNAEKATTEPAAPVLVTVVKAKTGETVAEGITREAAETMIAKAKAGKKAALTIAS